MQVQANSDQDTSIKVELPAQLRCLALIRACVHELIELTDESFSEDVIYGLQLAVHEICNNIIEHAYGHEQGKIEMTLCVQPSAHTFTVDLYDDGIPFDPESIEAPNLDEPQVEGYGLYLVQQIMDEVSYDTRNGKNHWRLRKQY